MAGNLSNFLILTFHRYLVLSGSISYGPGGSWWLRAAPGHWQPGKAVDPGTRPGAPGRSGFSAGCWGSRGGKPATATPPTRCSYSVLRAPPSYCFPGRRTAQVCPGPTASASLACMRCVFPASSFLLLASLLVLGARPPPRDCLWLLSSANAPRLRTNLLMPVTLTYLRPLQLPRVQAHVPSCLPPSQTHHVPRHLTFPTPSFLHKAPWPPGHSVSKPEIQTPGFPFRAQLPPSALPDGCPTARDPQSLTATSPGRALGILFTGSKAKIKHGAC